MILMKTARLATNQNHHDSTVDIAGYAACLGDIQWNAQQIHIGTNFAVGSEFNPQFNPKDVAKGTDYSEAKWDNFSNDSKLQQKG